MRGLLAGYSTWEISWRRRTYMVRSMKQLLTHLFSQQHTTQGMVACAKHMSAREFYSTDSCHTYGKRKGLTLQERITHIPTTQDTGRIFSSIPTTFPPKQRSGNPTLVGYTLHTQTGTSSGHNTVLQHLRPHCETGGIGRHIRLRQS